MAMGIVDWCEKYSVHDKEIDEHHQRLFGIVNDLHTAILGRKGKKEIRPVIDRLIEHAKSHFAVEERLMESFSYPHFRQHKAEHEKLIRQVGEMDQKLRKTGGLPECDLFAFLIKEWLIEHILKEDKSYAPYLTNRHAVRSAKTSPAMSRQIRAS
jgi:hemerythrin